MSIQTAIEITAELNNLGKVGDQNYGYLINWETLPWMLPLDSWENHDYWLIFPSWEKLANNHGLDVSKNACQHTEGSIWISQKLKNINDDHNWEK